ncbi:MAG TPA: glycoside hydrolase family 3 C-terminal domain-containing protein, partial [Paludibacter sp.]
SELKPQVEISPLQGMIDKYGKDHVIFSLGYASGKPNYSNELPSPYNADSLAKAAVEVARNADVVIFFGGLNKNFRQDCEGDDRKNMDLPFGQNELIAKLLEVNKNLGIVIVSGNAVSMPWLNKVNGLMQSWYLGSQGGVATANIISGDANPSGKLPFSIPKKLEDNGANSFGTEAYPGNGTDVVYKEDILVGYRWFDTKKIEPLFPFGYGLSYTTYQYGKTKTDKSAYKSDETAKITFTLTNTGKVAGSESVQLYVSQRNPSMLRPAKELKGFTKVALDAGETKTVEMLLKLNDMAFYNDKIGAWTLEPDDYVISIASSSRSIKSSNIIKVTR